MTYAVGNIERKWKLEKDTEQVANNKKATLKE